MARLVKKGEFVPGEERLATFLQDNLSDEYTVVCNITVEGRQIDNVVVGPQAIFVIEGKCWEGIIRGEDQGPWQQQKPPGEIKTRENPLDQADVHSKVVKRFLREKFPKLNCWDESLLVFTHPQGRLDLFLREGTHSTKVLELPALATYMAGFPLKPGSNPLSSENREAIVEVLEHPTRSPDFGPVPVPVSRGGEMSNWLERYRGYILITVINLIVLGVVIVFLRRPAQPELIVTSPLPTATPLPAPTPAPVQVYVSGAVTRPDVYELPPESIIKDAIEAAGGATSEADLNRINLALSVADGQHIYVPHQGEESPPVSPPTQPPDTAGGQAGSKININTASQSEIETLPGIGPTRAQGIIEERPYDSIEDIRKVPGIGEVTFQKLKDLITVE